MKLEETIEKMKSFQSFLLSFLDDEEQSEENYQNMKNIYSSCNFTDNKPELKLFLSLIQKVFHDHHRSSTFYDRIFQALSIFLDDIKKNFSNLEIFNIFKDDKRLLLFLIEKGLLFIDSKIARKMRGGKLYNYAYPIYFGLKNCKEDEKEIFNKKREIGENDNYICQLIRNDTISEFVAHLNQANIQIKSYTVPPSIYETNSFLLENKPTLIEYAAFFGSIQAFKYLMMNGAEMSPSLWEYAIHSNNAEMIHILEEQKVTPNDSTYNQCLEEAMKCHHNQVANYIQANLCDNIDKKKQIISSLHFYNYEFYPTKFDCDDNDIFINACQYGHFFIVEDILSKGRVNVNYILNCPYHGDNGQDKDKGEDDYNGKDDDKSKQKNTKISEDFTKWNRISYLSREISKIEYRNDNKCSYTDQEITALHFAVENEDVDITKLLLKHPKINVNQVLIRYYQEVKNHHHGNIDTKKEEKTALHIVAENGNLEIAKLLCEKQNIDVNKKTLDSYPSNDDARERLTPLYLAIENDNTEVAECLIKHPEISINLKSTYERWWNGGKEEYEEKAPLAFACEKGNFEICQAILLHKDVDVNQKLVEFYTTANLSYVHKRKEAALHIAIRKQYYKIIDILLNNESIDVNDLSIKEYRFYKYERTKQMKSPLFLAIEKDDSKTVLLLLEKNNIDINFGLLDIGGGSNLKGRNSIGYYHPRIRKDKERPIRRESERRLDYLNYRKDNYTKNGAFSRRKMMENIKKYQEMGEEEDINDELSYNYRIFDKMSPFEAAKKKGNKEILEYFKDKKEIVEEEDAEEEEEDRYELFDEYDEYIY